MKLLIHKNELMFDFLKRLQFNLHRPNDFSYEFAVSNIRKKCISKLVMPMYPSIWISDADKRNKEMLDFEIKRQEYNNKIKEMEFFNPDPECVKKYIYENLMLIKVDEWRFIGDGYFEVSGERIE